MIHIILALLLAAGMQQARQGRQDDRLAGFHWLQGSGETRGIVYEGRKLTSLMVERADQASVEVETETSRPDANSMRTTRRVFGIGANGERRLVELTVEDIRIAGGERISASRTVSRRDANGRMSLVRKDTQETAPGGPGEFRTQTTIQLANANNRLDPSEQIVQLERKKSDDVCEIDRTQMLPNTNGGWSAAERRMSATRTSEGQTSVTEDVYRQDAAGKLSLNRRISAREWTDAQGRENQQSDTYLSDLHGRLQLDSRSILIQETFADGSRQTSQTMMQISPAHPSEGLRLIEKVIETARPADAKTTEKETEVQAPDANGVLRTISFIRTTVVK